MEAELYGKDAEPLKTFNGSAGDVIRKRTPTSVDAKPQLVFISQPSGVALASLENQYTCDDSAGLGQTIYSLDYGAVLQNVCGAIPY